uniref:Protein kinase domain-containing protein n=1 Tax=Oryzias latipes TaxID=8090 RepID=A0A3P9K2Z8_ORYLA
MPRCIYFYFTFTFACKSARSAILASRCSSVSSTTTSLSSPSSLQENFILRSHEGVYIVEKFLGEGTFGKVAKCTNLSTNKEVAIKIIKKGFNHTAQDEIKAMIEISKIDAHKYNLFKCVDWFHYKSHVCMVFEMLDQSLFDFMNDRRSRPLFVQEIRDIAWQLLISLKGLKSINLVHCDIKLDNIMLVNQVSEPFRVKLIDFGLTKKTTDMRTGTRMQNICFRAPEVILGLPLDERLDMWTVGYVLALLYAGFYILPPGSEYDIIRNSKVVWKLDTPEQQSKKTGEQVKDEVDCCVPQRPAANSQERSSNKNMTSLVQQQKAEKRKAPAASRKRKNISLTEAGDLSKAKLLIASSTSDMVISASQSSLQPSSILGTKCLICF